MKTLILNALLIMGSVASALPTVSVKLPVGKNKLVKKASFKPTWQRYPPPDVFINTLQQQFPLGDISSIDEDCKALTDGNRSLLGDSEPLTGSPSIDNPNSSTANWYNRCLASYIKAEASNISPYAKTTKTDGSTDYVEQTRPQSFFVDYFGPKVVSEALHARYGGGGVDKDGGMEGGTFFISWSELSADARNEMIRTQVERLVGPEDVILDLGLAASEDEFINRVSTIVDAFSAKPDATTFAFLDVTNPSYVTARDVVKIAQYLILFHDTHKE